MNPDVTDTESRQATSTGSHGILRRTLMPIRRAIDPRSQPHAVQFYRSDENLCTTVACFLAEGLILGQPSIAILTETHRQRTVEHLRCRYIDCDRAIGAGELVLLDAAATLDSFMVLESPDWDLFQEKVGELLNRVRPQTPVRVFGEAVDILWRRGHPEAALTLEMFWNRVSGHYNLSLLCGYAVASFYDQMQQLERVCAQHSHMVVDDHNVMYFPTRSPSAR
jgi:hypothetical protein